MYHCMKEVLVRTKPKDSFTLVPSDSSANIQTTFNPPLYLQANRNYELAMVMVALQEMETDRQVGRMIMWILDQYLEGATPRYLTMIPSLLTCEKCIMTES